MSEAAESAESVSPSTPTEEPSLREREFRGRSLRASRFLGCDLSGVIVRGSDIGGMELDSPWLLEGGGTLLVNGVDVVAFVDAELDRRFPGRSLRAADDPDGLRAAWAALESSWAATVHRATGLPPELVDASVDGEWSFAQTLRHLVMATDTWLGRAVLGRERPYHPFGLPNDDDDGAGSAAYTAADFASTPPTFDEVLAARADRQAMVRDYLATVTVDLLAEQRPNPHAPSHPETVLSCLRTILEEVWEHHRYAVRDLDTLLLQRDPG